MIFKPKEIWKKRVDQWVARRLPVRDKVRLSQRSVYILPSRSGLMFVIASGLVFIAAINYAVSLAFGLAFLMVSIFVLAIFYTFNNLNQLILANLPNQPVFCDEDVGFNVLLTRNPKRSHEALELKFSNAAVTHIDLVTQDREQAQVFARATKRGFFKAPPLRITTYFPLGLARAWSIVDLNMHCLVYPKPVAFVMDQFNLGTTGSEHSNITREGSEDFYGVRDYVPGDSMRQVAWKNVARGQGMQVKQFVDYVDNKLWLDWDMFYGFSVEERLSRLCYGVLQLAKTGSPYGLKLPGVEIPPGIGVGHRNKLLKALALYGSD